jgi:hypothetical protein
MARSPQGALPDGAARAVALPADCRAEAGKPAGSGDDSLLAALYMRMWAMASGRPLPRDVPPGELTEEELLAFWADDFRQHAARHAATAGDRK